jgi:hypothetical protein
MSPRSTRTPAALTEALLQLTEARKARADILERRRTAQLEGANLAEQIGQELVQAPAEGREPEGVDQLRERIDVLQQHIADLTEMERGVTLRVQRAEGAVDTARFRHLPELEHDLDARADDADKRAAQLVAQIQAARGEQEAIRAEYRGLVALIPGAGRVVFHENSSRPSTSLLDLTMPAMTSLEDPHQTWPPWMVQMHRRAVEMYGSNQDRQAIGLPAIAPSPVNMPIA